MRIALPFALVSLLAAACGGNVVLDGTATGGQGSTASTGGAGGGGAGAGGGGGGAVPFACGQVTCTAGEYCQVSPPGIEGPDGGVPPDGYACLPIPPSCAATPTCACLGEALGDGDPCSPAFTDMCTEDAEGSITTVCDDA